MKNLKEFADAISEEKLNSFVTKYNKVRKEAGGTELTDEQIKKMKTRRTGDTGRAVGSSYTLTGEIDFAHKIVDDSGETLSTYEAIKTEDGEWISITQLLGISSLSGYTLSGKETYVSREKANKKYPEIPQEVVCETVENLSIEDVWQPPTRIKLVFLAMLSENPDLLKGVKATFLGTIAKPFKARKDSPSFGDQYIAGDRRVIIAKLWNLK